MALATRQQHVVAVPLPAQGHLNPLMRFSHLLASHGVLVTFVDIDDVHHRLHLPLHGDDDDDQARQKRGVEKIRRVHIPLQGQGLDLSNDFRLSLRGFLEDIKRIESPLEALVHELNQQGPPVTCLISDFFFTIPTQKVADKLNLPRVALFPSSASMLLLLHYVTQGEQLSIAKVMDLRTTRGERRHIICEGLIGLPAIYNNDVPHYKHLVDETAYVWESHVKACNETFCHAHAVAINTFDDLEGQALMALSKNFNVPIYAVGPLIEPLLKESSTSLWKEDEACILWLNKQPPLSVLYISFGSITLLSQTQLEEIVEGLLSSQINFLWVFRRDLVENMEYSSTIVIDVISRSYGKGYVVDWAPQIQVLSHPSISGFLTHCGWNSTMESIAHGVPMLCWPYFGDQQLDAKYICEEWKVGCKFEARKDGSGLVERVEIERVIKSIIEGEEGIVLRQNAMNLKNSCSQILLPGGTSHNNIQSLIKSLI